MNHLEEKTQLFNNLIKQEKLGVVILFRPEELVMALGYQPLMGLAIAVFYPTHPPILYVAENEPLNRFTGEHPEIKQIKTDEDADFTTSLLKTIKADIELYGNKAHPIGYVEEVSQESPVGLIAEGKILNRKIIKELGEMAEMYCKDTSKAIHQLFCHKTDFDIKQIRRVHEIAAIAVATFYNSLEAGASEIDIKSDIEYKVALQANNNSIFMSQAWAFVQSGENTEKSGTYNVSGHRKLKERDFVLLELAICINGFWCDLTRTGFVGQPSTEAKTLYNAVECAQHTAIKKLKENVKACDVFSAASDRLEKKGYRHLFPHALGHGVGFRYHDYEPFLISNTTEKLTAGMVVTIEPGIYGKEIGGGIRIEDNILITPEGHEILSAKVPSGLKGEKY